MLIEFRMLDLLQVSQHALACYWYRHIQNRASRHPHDTGSRGGLFYRHDWYDIAISDTISAYMRHGIRAPRWATLVTPAKNLMATQKIRFRHMLNDSVYFSQAAISRDFLPITLAIHQQLISLTLWSFQTVSIFSFTLPSDACETQRLLLSLSKYAAQRIMRRSTPIFALFTSAMRCPNSISCRWCAYNS